MNKSETRRRSSGRITLSDVAKAAGVSPITASRALRGERGVTQELVQRVKDAAQQLGYVPDPAARALASQRSVQVPVLVPLLSNALFVDVLESVHRTLFPEGYQALIGVTHYDPQEEEQLLRTYLAHRPAGLLVTDGFIRKGINARLTRNDVIVSKTIIASLRRFKDDVPEVRAGLECSVVLQDTNDIKAGDILEVFEVEERERTL